MNWADATAKERQEWFWFHRDPLAIEREIFEEAARRYSSAIVRFGAAEKPSLTAERIHADIMSNADAILAQEVQEDFDV